MNFERYAASGNQFLNDVMRALESSDSAHAGRVLRSVLHALRQRLPPEESLQLIAQLPVVIKGVYVDGWRLSEVPDKSIRTASDFLQTVMDQGGAATQRDFPSEARTQKAVSAVFRVLRQHVSEGEIQDVVRCLPEPVAELWQ